MVYRIVESVVYNVEAENATEAAAKFLSRKDSDEGFVSVIDRTIQEDESGNDAEIDRDDNRVTFF
jgi:hypothetical protein